MLEIRPIQDGDMEYVLANPFQKSLKDYPDMTPPADSVSVIFDGEIVAIGGVVDLSEGIGETWLILTKQSRKKGIFGLIALSAIEKTMNELICAHKLKQCNAKVRVDFPEAIKMIEAFGFEYKETKPQYTPDGCDVRVYSRLYNE